MRNCVNAGTCSCGCPSRCGGGSHCDQHSNGCHISCTKPESKQVKDSIRRPPRERDDLGRFRKR